MKLERISSNQIKYSITFEELTCRGFMEEEILKESFIWDALFDEMLEEAARTFQLETYEAVSIEIFSLTSKELVLILTLDEDEINQPSTEEAKKYISDETRSLIVSFNDFEDCILLIKRLNQLKITNPTISLYTLNSYYHLAINRHGTCSESLIGICEEYGNIQNTSVPFLDEYGDKIIEDNAMEMILKYF